jgi:hypothetical protein
MQRGASLSWIGCGLLVSGWIIVMASLLLLTSLGQRFGFVASGLAVEVMGLALVARGFMLRQRGDGGDAR